MHLLGPIAAFGLLLGTAIPGIVASPVEQSSDDAALESRANPIARPGNGQCTNPAQISLATDHGVDDLGSCGWKMWMACTAFAAAVCITPCSTGGLADPICDLCVAGLGGMNCVKCIKGVAEEELWDWLMDFSAPLQPQIVASLQSQYCETPKPFVNSIQAPVSKPTSSAAAAA